MTTVRFYCKIIINANGKFAKINKTDLKIKKNNFSIEEKEFAW